MKMYGHSLYAVSLADLSFFAAGDGGTKLDCILLLF